MDPKTKQLVEEAEAIVRSESATDSDHDECELRWSTRGLGMAKFENERDCDLFNMSRKTITALCYAVREQDQRAQHAEAERDAFSERIEELETQIRIRDKIIEAGNKLRLVVANIPGTSATLRELAFEFGAIQCNGVVFSECGKQDARFEPSDSTSPRQTAESR
jgi:hypothetical protein